MGGFDPHILALIFVIFVIGGIVKGAVAIGLPTVALILLALFMPVRSATALMLLPLLASNVMMAYRGGHYLRTIKRYWYFIVPQSVLIVIVAYLSRDFEDGSLRVILGAGVIIFSLTGLIGAFPRISERYHRSASVGFGIFGGILGGLNAVWAPSVVIYLSAFATEKEEFVRATGMIVTFGAIPLLASHIALGHFVMENTPLSFAVLVPAMIGFFIGEAIRHRISERIFRNGLFSVFLLLGINMILS